MQLRSLCRASVFFAALGIPVHAGTPTPFAPPSPGETTLYQDVTLIDAPGARAHMDILVEGQRIKDVFPRGAEREKKLKPTHTVALSGLYMMPGLIDSHVHLATPPNRKQAEAMLRRDLYGGVTAVRDMADDLRALGDISRAVLVGETPGADVYYAALMSGPTFFADPRTAAVSAGGAPGHVPWMQAVTGKTDLRLAVAEARGTFASGIKLYADLPPDLVARITSEAHRQHLRVWTHATIFPAIPSDAVDAGVDTISHSCLLVYQAAPQQATLFEKHGSVPLDQFRKGDSPVLANLFQDMKKHGTILDATVWTYSIAENGPSLTPKLDPRKCNGEVGAAITQQAYRAGVDISTGTDAPAPWTDPWPDVFHEFDWLVNHAHMPIGAVLRSATLVGARAAGQEADMGNIAAGKLANMVVLSKNPLDDLGNLKSIRFTVKRGRVYYRKDVVPLKDGDITDF